MCSSKIKNLGMRTWYSKSLVASEDKEFGDEYFILRNIVATMFDDTKKALHSFFYNEFHSINSL